MVAHCIDEYIWVRDALVDEQTLLEFPNLTADWVEEVLLQCYGSSDFLCFVLRSRGDRPSRPRFGENRSLSTSAEYEGNEPHRTNFALPP